MVSYNNNAALRITWCIILSLSRTPISTASSRSNQLRLSRKFEARYISHICFADGSVCGAACRPQAVSDIINNNWQNIISLSSHIISPRRQELKGNGRFYQDKYGWDDWPPKRPERPIQGWLSWPGLVGADSTT